MQVGSTWSTAACARSALRCLSAIEAALLGWAPPPVTAVIAAERWRRDELGDWCLGCGGGLRSATGGCRCDGSPSQEAPTEADWVIRLGAYEEPLRGWLLGIKHRGWTAMATRLGVELAEQYLDAASDPWQAADSAAVAIVPMPMPSWRRRLRGIDHAAVIAGAFADRLQGHSAGDSPVINARCCSPLVRNAVRPQAGRSAAARRRVGRRGFATRSPDGAFGALARLIGWPPRERWTGWGLDGATVVLVDDVLTTGTSIRASIRHLRALGASKIGVAVVAVTDLR